jgi:hypothetical protein
MCCLGTTCASAEVLPRLANAKGEQPGGRFSIRSGRGVLRILNGDVIICTSDEVNNAKLTAANTGDAPSLILKGCRKGTVGCKTAGAAAEEIQTVEITFTPVFVPPPPAVGWMIFEKGPGPGVLATIECGGETFYVREGVIGTITPVNKLTKTFKVEYSEKCGHMQPAEYINSKEEHVVVHLETEGEGEEAFAFKETTFTSSEEMTFEEEVELKT